jgi:hypothetical protein
MTDTDFSPPNPHRSDVLNYEHFDCCGQGMVPKDEATQTFCPPSAVPPGPYAGGARSPVAYVLLCPSCAGYPPMTDPDYSGFLTGTCQGCGTGFRELHRFPARIDSAGGCRCRGQHPQRTGDLQDAPDARWQALRSEIQQDRAIYQEAVDNPESERKEAIAAGYVDAYDKVLGYLDRAEKGDQQ